MERRSVNLLPAVFLDRDGVINEDLHHVYRVEDFRFLPGTIEGLSLLQSMGYLLIVVTNQAGIAKGKYTEAQYQSLTQHMQKLLRAQGVALAGVYHCPHHPEGSVVALAVQCDCRKPRPGMILRAAAENAVDLARSVLIGDKLSDIQAAHAAGVGKSILVRSGHVLPADAESFANQCLPTLLDAALWIKQQAAITTPIT